MWGLDFRVEVGDCWPAPFARNAGHVRHLACMRRRKARAADFRVEVQVPSRPRTRPPHSALNLLQVWPPPTPSHCIAHEYEKPPRWAPCPSVQRGRIGAHFSVSFPRRYFGIVVFWSVFFEFTVGPHVSAALPRCIRVLQTWMPRAFFLRTPSSLM